MASDQADLGQLSPSQQEALQQYTQVTNQDQADALPLLQRSEWNVQIAISKFFDGEGPDLVQEAIAARAARHENLQESLEADANYDPWGAVRERTDPAPRVVPRPPVVHRPGLLLGLVLIPFNTGHRFVSVLYRVLIYLLSFLPRRLQPRASTGAISAGLYNTDRRQLLPRDTAARFKHEFEEEYGPNPLPFHEGGFAQALDIAKRDLKFLLLVLISPEHDDTDSFVRDTLLSPEVTAFLTDPATPLILWAGNTLDSEAYQVATDYSATKFPFSALVCLTPREGSTRMGTVKRLAGPMPAQTYLAEMQSAVARYAPELAAARADRREQEAARSLRTEQDSAYERSLARDRERARQRREAAEAEAEARDRAAREAEQAAATGKRREAWRRWRAGRIAAEPAPGAAEVVRVAVKMPEAGGAGRVVRRFAPETTLEELYAFVECYDLLSGGAGADGPAGAKPADYEHEYRFRVASLMPRAVLEPSTSATMGEKIGRSGNLIVEDVSGDWDDGNGGDGE